MATKLIDRTYPIVAVARVGAANVGAGNEATFTVPMDALLLRLSVVTAVAFNGTTPNLTVSDGTTTFANAVDVASAGNEVVNGAPKFYPLGATFTVSLAGADVTTGDALVVAEYVRPGNGIAGVQE